MKFTKKTNNWYPLIYFEDELKKIKKKNFDNFQKKHPLGNTNIISPNYSSVSELMDFNGKTETSTYEDASLDLTMVDIDDLKKEKVSFDHPELFLTAFILLFYLFFEIVKKGW